MIINVTAKTCLKVTAKSIKKCLLLDDDTTHMVTDETTYHKEIAMACAEAGKMILCEKPLAMNTAEGEEMCDAVEKAGVANIVWYNYRRVPAVTLAKQLIDEGRLGRIFHYRANFLQDWTISTDLPQGGEALVEKKKEGQNNVSAPSADGDNDGAENETHSVKLLPGLI